MRWGYVLHVRSEEGFDVVTERLIDAGDANEGDEGFEQVVDIEWVGDAATEKR